MTHLSKERQQKETFMRTAGNAEINNIYQYVILKRPKDLIFYVPLYCRDTEENMDDWDEAKLEEVITKKHGTEKSNATDIVSIILIC